MEPREVKGLLQMKTSSKGNKYLCIDIQLTPTYTKTIFFEKAEEEILKLALGIQRQQ